MTPLPPPARMNLPTAMRAGFWRADGSGAHRRTAGWLLSLLDQGNAELLERLLETASSRRMAETLETMLRNILADAAELRELLEKEGLKPTSGLMKALAALPGRLDPSRPAGVKEITSVYLCEERPLDAGPECTARLAALRRDISLAKTARAVFQDARRLAPFLELAFLALNELPERQNAAGLLPPPVCRRWPPAC